MFAIDTSVVASWCFPDEAHAGADAAFRRIAKDTACAPVLLWFELRNVLIMGERRGRLTAAQIGRFLGHVAKLPIEEDRQPDEVRLLGLARSHRLSIYDAAYLELAQRRAIPLATLDDALMKAARAEKIELVGENA
jgi:predicted nucleic acid-binding protein